MILSVKDREDFKVMRKKLSFALNNGVIENNDVGIMTATLISKILELGKTKDLLSEEDIKKLDDSLLLAIKVGNPDDTAR